jgi:hypothetical protein
MVNDIRTYLVGRRNSTIACDISLPESEKSVSRKHLELTLTADGRCYLVHVHSRNSTKVLSRDGGWVSISQDYVELDTPLLLGEYRTSARALLALLPRSDSSHVAPSPGAGHGVEWDPDRGTFVQR